MFKPKTERMDLLAQVFPKRIEEVDKIFNTSTVIYIDWANVIHWQEKLDWHIDLVRIKQFLDSFSSVKKVRFYGGTLNNNKKSKEQIKEATDVGYVVSTKPVKIMRVSIDVSSISNESPEILKNFLKKSLLKKMDIETISFINSKLSLLNQQGIKFLEEQKCNFDVEIGRDMLSDYNSNEYDNFILWSGDSDFQSPIKQLLEAKKNVFIFSISGRVTPELQTLNVPVFDIRKIREFVCWGKDIPEEVKTKMAQIKAKGTPEGAPKL